MSRSLAAAYAVKKMAKKSHRADCPGCDMCHGGMMAEGGEIGVHKPAYEGEKGKSLGHSETGNDVRSMRYNNRSPFDPKAAGERAKEKHHKVLGELRGMKKPELYAEGGEVHDDDDMVDRIMLKRMAAGGVIANDDEPEADAESADFDDLVEDDQLEGEYPGSQEIGDEREDDDRKDIVGRIMRSRSKKDRMPRPA